MENKVRPWIWKCRAFVQRFLANSFVLSFILSFSLFLSFSLLLARIIKSEHSKNDFNTISGFSLKHMMFRWSDTPSGILRSDREVRFSVYPFDKRNAAIPAFAGLWNVTRRQANTGIARGVVLFVDGFVQLKNKPKAVSKITSVFIPIRFARFAIETHRD